MSKSIFELRKNINTSGINVTTIIKDGCVIEFGDDKFKDLLGKVFTLSKITNRYLYIIDESGLESKISMPKSNLVEYTDKTLTIFFSGFRELTEGEKMIRDGGKGISDKLLEKQYYKDRNAEYLFGEKEERGMKFHPNLNKVLDSKVKGYIYNKFKIIN